MKTIEELKALREEWEVNSLTRGSNNQERREVLAIIDTALAVIAERDALKKDLDEAIALALRASGSLTASEMDNASARSLAMEEAARTLDTTVHLFAEIDMPMTRQQERAHWAAAIRALAPLPSGLVAVSAEGVDACRRAWGADSPAFLKLNAPSGLVAVRKEAVDALESVAENASANPYAYDHERGYRCCRGCGRAERKETHAADCEWLKARAALALLKEPR